MKGMRIGVVLIGALAVAQPLSAQEDPLDLKVAVAVGVERAEEVALTFPSMDQVPAAVLGRAASGSAIELIVEGDTPSGLVGSAQRHLQEQGAWALRLRTEEDPGAAAVRLTASGNTIVTFGASEDADAIRRAGPVLRELLPSSAVTLHVAGESPARVYFGVQEELQEMGARFFAVR